MGFILLAIIFIVLAIMFDFLIPCVEAARHTTCAGKNFEVQAIGTLIGGIWQFSIGVVEAPTPTADEIEDWLKRQQKRPGPKWPYGIVAGISLAILIVDLIVDPEPAPDPEQATRPGGTATDKSDDERVTLYRAVSLEEANDIQACSCFRPGPLSMAAKWFWASYENAVTFGRKSWGGVPFQPFRVASASIRTTLLPSFKPRPHHDGIGLAYVVEEYQLPAFNIAVAGTIFVDPTVYSPTE